MQKFKKMLPYFAVLLLAFYALPLLIQDTGTAMVVMLVGLPLVTLVTSAVYGGLNGFNIIYPLVVAVLFAPSIFVFYNSSAWVYIVAYGVIALIGNGVGLPIYFSLKKGK